ncbi:hypothetical protein SAMN05192554_10126 [Haloarchaeobius iranensis]|jgi:hypothetical protein|uniref:Uncharacterized protein n=1 Tax=Haloarchaeobius iranensis TaxID=996166 RepID=A0A1G9S9B9_9EURY|nr:hypothetical protein SAMN05192554_10126 [Haloarchaeobius iranensis]
MPEFNRQQIIAIFFVVLMIGSSVVGVLAAF